MGKKATQPKQSQPLLYAVVVFAASFSFVLLLAFFYDFSQIDLGGLLFLMSFLCCLFLAKNTYDVAAVNRVSSSIAHSSEVDRLLGSDELYAQLFNNSPVPYLILDGSGFVRSANLAAVRLLGVTYKDLRGGYIFTQLESVEEQHLDFLVEKYRSGVPVSEELVRINRPDKREAWALLSVFNYTDVDGEIIGLMTLVDITKQKKAEDAKSEFVSLASHQLRTPIAGMKWSAELLQLDNPETLTDRQQRYINRLLISIDRMAVLVDDFLRVSRFELGTFQPEYESVALEELFEDIMHEQAARVEQKRLTVKTDFAADVDVIHSDPNLLRMIITNLYTNAIKYTRERGDVHLSFKREDERLIITVSDNGMGIPPEDQDGIFTKLFRASNAVRDVPDGTGLGLYIVREAVAVLKGQVTFTTQQNVGTTFTVTLPYEPATAKG